VNIGVLDLDRVVVLGILVDTSVGVDGDGHVEGLSLIISGRTTEGGAAVVRTPVTLEWGSEGVARVDIGVLDIDRVVILAVFVHIAVDISGDGTAIADPLIITRGATKGSSSRNMVRVSSRAVATTSGSTESSTAWSGALDPIDVLVVLNDAEVVTVEVAIVIVIGLVERRGATEVRGASRATTLHPVVVKIVLNHIEVIAIEVVVVVAISLIERRGATEVGTAVNRVFLNMGRRALEVRRRMHVDRSNDRSRVDILVLDIDRVVVLGRLVDVGVEVTSDGHVEGLAFIVARRTALSSAAGRPAALDGERTSTRGESRARVNVRWVDISVLDLDGVIILAELVHVGVSVNAGGIGNIEGSILIVS
jgi:hypothetical protein